LSHRKAFHLRQTLHWKFFEENGQNFFGDIAIHSRNKFEKLFQIKDEVVVREFECNIKSKKYKNARGNLYVTQQYVCFAANSFGLKVREIISFEDIKNITKKKSSVHIEKDDEEKPYVFALYDALQDGFAVIKDIWKTKSNDSKKNPKLHSSSEEKK